MAQNLIRLKQLEQSELTGLMLDVIESNLYELTYQGGTGINIVNVAGINLSGVGINLYNSIVSGNLYTTGYFGNIYINGQQVATSANLFNTGSTLYTYIEQLSGDFNSSGSVLNSYIESLSGDLNETGAILNSYIESLSGISVLRYSDQIISGNKTFLNNFIVSGTGSAFPILQITGVNDILINGNSSFGNYVIKDPSYTNHKLFKTNYLRTGGLQNIQISGLKTNNIINVFSNDAILDPNILVKSYQYIMVDGPIPNSYNAINITGGLYSGKGLRRFKTGPTIANGYKNIPSLQSGGALIVPKQKYLETVYNITVESGKGAIRPLTFNTPNITTANNPIITLKLNFQADTGVCIVSGRYPDSNPIFTITGANYDFIQTERLMYHSSASATNGAIYVRI